MHCDVCILTFFTYRCENCLFLWQLFSEREGDEAAPDGTAAVGSFLRCIPVRRLLMLLLWQMVTLRSKSEVLSGITPGVRSNIRICRDPALNNDVMAGPSPPLPDASGWVAGTVLLVGSGQRPRRPTGPLSSHQSRTHRLLLRRTGRAVGRSWCLASPCLFS